MKEKRYREVNNWKPITAIRQEFNKLERADRREVTVNDVDPLQTRTYSAIYNTTRDTMVSLNKSKALLLQHMTVMNTFADLFENQFPSAKASLRNNGNKVEMDVLLDSRTLDGEEYQRGVSIKSEFGKGVTVQLYMVRSVCANGMVLGKDIKATIHIQREDELARYAQTSVEKVFGHKEDNLITAVQRAKNTIVPKTVTYHLVKSMFHGKHHRNAILNKIEEENPKAEENTIWQIYNGITNYITYAAEITTGFERQAHSKAQSLLLTINKYQNILEQNEVSKRQ